MICIPVIKFVYITYLMQHQSTSRYQYRSASTNQQQLSSIKRIITQHSQPSTNQTSIDTSIVQHSQQPSTNQQWPSSVKQYHAALAFLPFRTVKRYHSALSRLSSTTAINQAGLTFSHPDYQHRLSIKLVSQPSISSRNISTAIHRARCRVSINNLPSESTYVKK